MSTSKSEGKSWKARLIGWLGAAVSIAVAAYLLSQFDLGESLGAIKLANPVYLALAAGLYLALFPLRGLRWRVMLKGVADISTGSATEIFMIGAMANNLLPARLGDVARAFLLARREKIDTATTFSNVLLERVIDGVFVVGFLTAVLVTAPPGAEWVRSVGATMAILFAVGMGGACLFAWNESRAMKLVDLFLSPLPDGLAGKLRALIVQLTRGLDVLKNPEAMIVVVGSSLLVWTLEVGVYVLAQAAFGLEIPLSGLVLTMAILTLGLTAPSAPGFVGVFEGLIVTAVALYAVTGPVALAFAMTVHLIHYVPVTLLGLAFAYRSGLKITELEDAARAPDVGASPEGA